MALLMCGVDCGLTDPTLLALVSGVVLRTSEVGRAINRSAEAGTAPNVAAVVPEER